MKDTLYPRIPDPFLLYIINVLFFDATRKNIYDFAFICAYVSIARNHRTFLVFSFLTPFYRLRVIHKRERRVRRTSDCLRTTHTIPTR